MKLLDYKIIDKIYYLIVYLLLFIISYTWVITPNFNIVRVMSLSILILFFLIFDDEKLINTLFIFIPFSPILVISQNTTNIILVFFTIFLIKIIIKNNYIKKYNILFILLFILINIFNIIYQSEINTTAIRELLQIILGMIFLGFSFNNRIKYTNKTIYLLALSTFFSIIIVIIFPNMNIYKGSGYIPGFEEIKRFSAIQPGNSFAFYVISLILLFLCIYKYNKTNKDLIILLFFIFIIIINFSKTFLLLAAIYFIYFLLSKLRIKKKKISLSKIFFITAILILIIFLFLYYFEQIKSLFITVVKIYYNRIYETEGGITTGRIDLIGEYINAFIKSDIIPQFIGHGINPFITDFANRVQPSHNLLIDTLYFFGIFGSFLYILFLSINILKHSDFYKYEIYEWFILFLFILLINTISIYKYIEFYLIFGIIIFKLDTNRHNKNRRFE